MTALNSFLYIAWPYVAVTVFLVGTIYRYRQTGFKVSSLSSQFLEGRKGFWTVPFHWGLVVVFFGHLTAFLMPETTLAWNSSPARLIILEVTAFTFGVTLVISIAGLIIRRFTNDRVAVVTSKMDIAIELLLFAQFVLGCWIAVGYRWGASWFAADLSPYLWSLVYFKPDIAAVSAMPTVIQLHIIGAFLIIFMVPFTRLVHLLVAPFHYIGRPFQQVIWYWDKKAIRDPQTAWSEKRPKNN